MNAHTNLKTVLLAEAAGTYSITEKLFRRVSDRELSWRPSSGNNWMTVGQLLMHCANYGCGKAVHGFVTGRWSDLDSDENTDHVPAADSLPSVTSVEEALDLLSSDRCVAFECLEMAQESDLLSKEIRAPWGGPDLTLFQHLSLMIRHLDQHKGQLFYYLKLMGKDVNTRDLWGEG